MLHTFQAEPGHCVSVAALWFPQNVKQGRGSTARRLCHKNRVSRVLRRFPRKPPRRLSWKSSKYSAYAIFVTQPARGTPTPLFDVLREPKGGHRYAMAGFGLESVQHSTFPAKINDLEAFKRVFGRFRGLRV